MRHITFILSVLLAISSAPVVANNDPYTRMLPVVTPALTPGKVIPKTLDKANSSRPIFIVGDDPLSYRWLKARHKKLKALNAMGIVVNVHDSAGLNRLRQYQLPVYPVRGNDFAKAFDLKHYPVLINNKKVTQ